MSKEPLQTTPRRKPAIELIPIRPAVRSDGATELTVLVRVVPSAPDSELRRPRLNLGLVLDRSGSMSGAKLKAAKAAAIYAVQQLLATDRISVTIYDDAVETFVPSTLATAKTSIIDRIEGVRTAGSTALHAGWIEGGVQVSKHFEAGLLNRVLLLTDGLANVGVTEPRAIVKDVQGLAKRGVSTTAMGVGTDFNEDLLEAMATAGDGNYYFIEGPADFDRIFTAELQGIIATQGQKVSLGCEPQGGVEVVDVLNDLPTNSYGRLLLPNLIAGLPIDIVVKLQVPPRKGESDICCFRLAYDDPQTGERVVLREVLSLPATTSEEWSALPEQEQVREQAVHKEALRIRQEAITAMERDDYAAAQSHLTRHYDYVSSEAPSAPWLSEELAETEDLQERLQTGETEGARKLAKYASYRKRRSR